MAPTCQSWDLWSDESSEDAIMMDILLPNGYFLNLETKRDATLLEVKMEAWEAAQQCPLYGLLHHDIDSYLFVCVNPSTAEQEEQIDEEKRLCDIRPFQAVLRLVERKGNEYEKKLNSQIRSLIGKSLHDFAAQNNPEVNDFRRNMRAFGERILEIRRERFESCISEEERLMSEWPASLEANDEPGLPPYLASKLSKDKLVVTIRMAYSGAESTFKLSVSPDGTASELLHTVLRKKACSGGIGEQDPSLFCLKVCGMEEYLAGPHPLSRHTFIREMISSEKTPELLLVPINSIDAKDCEASDDRTSDSTQNQRIRSKSDASSLTRKKRQVSIPTWDVDETFSLVVHYVHRLSNCCSSSRKVGMKFCLYHGDELLCKPVHTEQRNYDEKDEDELAWEECLNFEDITIDNMPRMAKICICIYELTRLPSSGRARKQQSQQDAHYMNPLSWVNTTVFDYRGVLRTGPITLYLWPYEDELDADILLNPLGGLTNNPSQDEAVILTLSFKKYHEFSPLVYPGLEKVLDFEESLPNGVDESPLSDEARKSQLEQLRRICERDSLCQMHEQEKELMWLLRSECCDLFPNSLPKLLKCLKWNDRREVAQMIALLQKWPRIPAVKALELLDYAYADSEVRKYAVDCLRNMSDQELSLYSLQLVRALKHEAYLQSDLVEFMLERALFNRHIGHKIFWLLRSEMKSPDVSIRFGLILEAYCRGETKCLGALAKQVEALNKLKIASQLVQNEGNRKKEGKEKLKSLIQELLNQKCYQETFKELHNPLDPRYRFKKLRSERCKFLDSKMRPLWLAFENKDVYGKDVFVIFKNGDDLRQDMLSLQMIRIMDTMWKEEGLDLRMIPYQCLATDHKMGLIEVVPDSDTIANIQKEKGFTPTSAFKKGSLLAWLRDHNPDDKSLKKAIEEFTLSCAGYCVATYVLGVADRHSDNIMVKTNGQLFHIDFGHILGKFKEKFGIKRERVPFVLTHDFVYIITNGQTQKSQEFSRFQTYCEQAFTILRRKGPVLISLFAMMLSTGIPELNSEKDLDYLRETLVLDMSEQDAIRHFRAKFDEALKNSWKTSMNWMAHNLTKDNKMTE